MANKHDMITHLADYTAKCILQNPLEYIRFLRCAGQNYKYSFQDQILIYAQKPDATACAEFDTWKELGRYVNRGTKGIALLTDDGYRRLRHVFDIADTNSFAGRKVYVWQMEERFEDVVTEALNNSFGPLDDSGGFLPFLIAAVSNAVEDNLPDYLLDLQDMKGAPSPDTFKSLLTNSVIYMVMHRCGMKPESILFDGDFSGIAEFGSTDSFMILGYASSSISEMLLREIGDTVRNIEISEKKKNRTFAMSSGRGYNDSNNTNTERGNEHGTDLPDGRQLPASQSQRSDTSRTGEVRQSPQGVSEESPETAVHVSASDGQAEQPSGGNRPAGGEHDGDLDLADGQGRGTDGGTENPQPNGVGAEDEQHPPLRGGDGERGADLSLTGSNEQENIEAEAEDEKSSAFTISQETIDAVLTRGSGVHEGKYRIYEQFLKKESTEDNVRFLKKEYGEGGSFPATIIDGVDIGEDHGGKGIRLRAGSIVAPTAEIRLTWPQVAKRICQLIEVDRYFNAAEKDYYDEYRRKEIARQERTVVGKEFIYIIRDYNEYLEQLGRKEETLNQYYLNDYAYCYMRGEKKSHVEKAEGVFIIPAMREAMETILAANTFLNDRAASMKAQMSSVHAKKLEPTYDELNPPPEIPKEYRCSLGDTVYLGTQEYEVLSIGDDEVRLYDVSFPLINKVVSRSEFENRLKENPLNDRLLQVIEEAPIVDETHPDSGNDEAQREAEKLSVYDRESEILYDVLGRLKIDDIELDYDENGLVAFDAMDNVWHGAEFYTFLVTEAFVFEDDGGVLGIPDELLQDFRELSEHNGVAFVVPRDGYETDEKPQDDHAFVSKDTPAKQQEEMALAQAEELISEFCRDEYDEEADFSDPFHVALAYSTTEDSCHDIEVEANLPEKRILFYVDHEVVSTIQCADMDDLISFLANLEFDQMIAFAEEQWKKQQADKTFIGRIDYLASNGTVGESVEYSDAKEFEEDIKENNYHGVPMSVTVYRNEDGSTIPHAFIAECDPPLQGFSIEDLTPVAKPYIDHYYVVEDLQAVPLEIKTFQELDKALNEYFYLPTGKVKAFGVQNTNELPGSLDFIQCKDGVDTLTEDYLKVEESAGWQNEEITALENRLKEEIGKRNKPLAPPSMPVKKEKLAPHILYPEITSNYRTNYHIEDDDIGVGTPLDRFYHNKSAIQLLKKLESEHRLAQPHEQNILANYVGWGGLPQFFEESNSHYQELKELLTEEEYDAARESMLTAFYTPPVVVRAIYEALGNLGFQTGNILEPACGIGNFMGLLPDSMQSSKLYGVELDSISGRIAQQLYQKNSIAVQGYEKTNLPDSFFDAAIGNVPFGQFKLPDKRYDKLNFSIHDYFFAKTLDKVRPGGVIAFITSSFTMDKQNPTVRKYIAQRADLLGAIRLPNNTFKAAAGTEVTSDILFLQKRDSLVDIQPDWVHLNTDENGIRISNYPSLKSASSTL